MSVLLVLNTALILSLLGSIAAQHLLCTQSTESFRNKSSWDTALLHKAAVVSVLLKGVMYGSHPPGNTTAAGLPQARHYVTGRQAPKDSWWLEVLLLFSPAWFKEGTQLHHKCIAGPVPRAQAHYVCTKLDRGAAMEFGQPEFYLLVLLLTAFVTQVRLIWPDSASFHQLKKYRKTRLYFPALSALSVCTVKVSKAVTSLTCMALMSFSWCQSHSDGNISHLQPPLSCHSRGES